MRKPLHVLLVEDTDDDARLVARELTSGGYDVTSERVETAEAMRAALEGRTWDLVISDYQMPRFTGLAALKLIQESGRDLPFIIVSGTIGEDVAVEAMKEGAHDYLMKGRLARLVPAVERELREAGERRERRRMEAELRSSEIRFRRLFEMSKDGILILSAQNGTVVDVNPFLIDRLGLTREQFLGRKVWSLRCFQAIVPDEAAFRNMRQHTDAPFESRSLETADGRRIDVEVVGTVYTVNHHTVMQCNFRDITERRQAELARQRSEAELRVAQRIALVGGWQLDLATGRVTFTEELYRIYGLDPARAAPDLAGHRRLFTEESWQRLTAALDRARETGEAYELELEMVRADGRNGWLLARGEVQRDEHGALTGLHGTAQDITERKQAEAALRRSEERFRNLTENTSDWIWEVNEQGNYTYVSPRIRNLLGFEPEEVLGRSVLTLMPPEEAAVMEKLFTELAAKRRPLVAIENVNLHKDGHPVVVETSAVPIFDVDGTWRGYRGIDRDITERKQAESALRASQERLRTEEARFRALVEKAHEAVSVLDADGRITYASPSNERVVGHPPETLLGRSAFELVHADDLATAREQLATLLKTPGEVLTTELRVVRLDAAVRWLNLTATNLLHLPSVRGVVVNYRDVTAEKEFELTLQRNERYFRALTDHSLDLVTVLAADGTVRFESPSVERILGWTPSELTGRSAFEVVHPEDLARVQAMFRDGLPKPGISAAAEYRCRHKDGTWRVLATIASNLLAEPAVAGIVLNSRDVTERVQAETALRASETQLSNAVKMARLGPWEYDVATDTFTFSDPFYAMLRTTAEREGGYTMTSRRYAERFVHPDDIAVVAAEVRRASEATDPHYSRHLEHRMIYADGAPGHLAVRFFVVQDERGRTVKSFGVNQDITERKEAEAALRRQQALFESLISTIPDRIYFKDRQSRFLLINDRMAQVAGLPEAGAAVGKTDFDLFGEEHARQAFQDEQKIMETGEPKVDYEEKENWLDGRVVWVSSTKFPLRDAQGRITGLVGISRDITERKNLEARYLQAQKMEAFGQLAGGVAHDFNNILSVILMQVNMLQLEQSLSGRMVSGLAELERFAMRGAGLTRQLLMFARRQEMETHQLNLGTLVEEASRMLRRVLGEHIAFEVLHPAEPVWIDADPGMIEQVLMNLCINARDAMRNGGRLTVGIRSESRTAPGGSAPAVFANLSVTDTGCGMDDATKARIFEPFFTTKPAGVGTGLGLATVYGIVQQHRGWVEVDSAPEHGSTFRVYFPVCAPPRQVDSSHPGLRGAPRGSESVLLVEDEAALRQMVAAALRGAGYRVVEAVTGPEALEEWAKTDANLDLLLTDYLLPGGMNGAQLAARLRETRPSLRVIIMSGYVPGHRDSRTPWPDRTPRLTKPFEAAKLLTMIRESFDRPAAT